jgi:hypothetical protein
MSEATAKLVKEKDAQRSHVEGQDWRRYDSWRVRPSKDREDHAATYLALNGELRLIPNPQTYENLFIDWQGIVEDNVLVDNMPKGAPFTDGAVLARNPDTTAVFLVTNGRKQHVPNPEVFAQFYFNGGKAINIVPIVIEFVPQGDDVG